MIRTIVKILLLSSFSLQSAGSQSFFPSQTDIFSNRTADSTLSVVLSRHFILESSIRVRVDSVAAAYFIFDKKSNSLTLPVPKNDSQNNPVIAISYQYIPLQLQPSYGLRSYIIKHDSTEKKKQRISVLRSDDTFTNIFGTEISKSGSISRGFIVGSNRDLTISSGFRLQMSGKLSDDIDIIAALTDENTPIQPQGNTQTLQEVDNIFVEIKSPVYTATLGDFQFTSPKSEFVTINRKLQGAKIIGSYQNISPKTQFVLTGATAKGKFTTNQFQGLEGVQGPYRLTGKNNERNIIIIAGTEKVYIDGEVMIRGDNNDYSIDYGSGEIIFSTNRLITSASRIVVDFEYSDRQFTRNFFGGSIESEISKKISVTTGYYREGDDQDSPIDISLSDQDKEILSAAGNTPAVKSAVTFVGIDSAGIGKGNYARIDTVINGDSAEYYRYDPATPSSMYSVGFSDVGISNGDYTREGVGRYRFVGKNNGRYMPIVILPAPQLHQLYSVLTSITPAENVVITGEYSASNFDRNKFSAIGDNANSGGAYKFSAQYSPKKILIGSANIGSAELTFFERYKDASFFTFDRTDVVEFGRKWSTDSLSSAISNYSEEIREGRVAYHPVDGMTASGGFGTLDHGGQFSASRYDASVDLKKENYPSLFYSAENISGEEKSSGVQSSWFRHKGTADYTIGSFVPSLRFEEENREIIDQKNESLASPSFSFLLYAPKAAVTDIYGVSLSSEFEWRKDKAFFEGSVIPQSKSFTQAYAFVLKEIENFSASSSVTFREKTYEKEFQSVNVNQQTTLVRIQSRYRPYSQGIDLDLYYDAASQRTAKLERVFYKVRKGEGQYIWVDANNNGVVDVDDENEFRPDRFDGEYIALTLNSDELIPVVNIKTSSRLKISPNKFIRERRSLFSMLISNISTETFFRLEEKSTEKNVDNIYYLRLSHFLTPMTTLSGFQFFQQDLFIYENDPGFSMRFRFNQRKGLSNYSGGIESNYAKERSLRTRLQVSNEISNQTDITFKNDNAASLSTINQPREIQSSSLVTDFSYRPEQFLEIGFKLETSQADDYTPVTPVTSNFNGQTIRTVVAFQGNGQLRIDFSREEIIFQKIPTGYRAPYELTGGRDIGKNYLWNASSEYRLAGNLQFSLQYSGRTSSRSNIIHTGRMEIRAFF